MSNIKNNKYKRKANYYDNGGSKNILVNKPSDSINSLDGISVGINNPSNILSSTTSLLNNTFNTANTNDIDIQPVKSFNTTDFDTLETSWTNFNPAAHLTYRDFRDGSNDAANIFKSTGSGVATGLSVAGPIGGVVGGVLGLLSSSIGAGVGKNRAIKKAQEANNIIDNNNQTALEGLKNSAINIGKQNSLNALSSYYAMGGNTKKNKFPLGGMMPNSNDITYFNTGGTHEENPYDGIQVGVDSEGTPNLVEEGEVKHNDYIFSNRLKATKELLNMVNLPEKYKGKTFAEIAKKLSKEAEERPNDPISTNGLNADMSKLQSAQETVRQQMQLEQYSANMFAMGGPSYWERGQDPHFYNEDINYIPQEGVDLAARLASPDLYSTKNNINYNPIALYNGRVTTDISPFTTPAEPRSLGSYPGYEPYRLPEFDYTSTPSSTTTISNISRPTGTTTTSTVTATSGSPRRSTTKKRTPIQTITGSLLPNGLQVQHSPSALDASLRYNNNNNNQEPIWEDLVGDSSVDSDSNKKRKIPNSYYLKYAPILGSAIGLIGSLKQKPDYTLPNKLEALANDIPTNYRGEPLGDYLQYKPFDRDYRYNQLNAMSEATRRAIRSSSAGNRAMAAANMIASDYNTQRSLGEIARQADEYNFNQRMQIGQFNRGTNQYNSSLKLGYDQLNTQNRAYKTQMLANAYGLREQIGNNLAQSRVANLTKLLDNLGNLGTDIYNKYNRDMLLDTETLMSPKDWEAAGYNPEEYTRYYNDYRSKRSYGGRISKK